MPIEIINKTESEAEINIFGDIMDEKWFDEDVTLKEVDESLKVLSKSKEINVNINSYGGSISAGVAIANRLKDHPAKIITNVVGIAASMGAVIAQVGDVRRIAKNAIFMIHNPMMGICGYYYAKELRKIADVSDKYRETIVGIFVDRTGQEQKQIESLMDEESYMTGEEAVEFGFADEIIPNKTVEAKNCAGKYMVNGVEFDAKRFNKMPKDFFKNQEETEPEPAPPPEPGPEQAPDLSIYEAQISNDNTNLLLQEAI